MLVFALPVGLLAGFAVIQGGMMLLKPFLVKLVTADGLRIKDIPVFLCISWQGVAAVVLLCIMTVLLFLVYCDRAWTAEAFSNIIKNCVEHTQAGGSVSVSVMQNNFGTSVTIEDNGDGIAGEDPPHIFECIYKGKHGSGENVGIGLALARQVIYLCWLRQFFGDIPWVFLNALEKCS